MDNFLIKTTIPSFHHSIIPWLKPNLSPQKISYNLIKFYNFREVIYLKEDKL